MFSAYFPNLTSNKDILLLGAMAEPLKNNNGGVAVSWDSEFTDAQAKRRLEVLSSLITWAAYHAGENPFAGDYRQTMAADDAGSPVSLERLLPFIKEPDKAAVPTVYWFARYLKAQDTRSVVIFLYNALGTLPDGYDGISELFLEADAVQLGGMFLQMVDVSRAEDDETAPAPDVPPISSAGLRQIENIYIKNARNCFPYLFD